VATLIHGAVRTMSGNDPNGSAHDASWQQGYRAAKLETLLWLQELLEEHITAAGQYDDTRSIQVVLKLVQDRMLAES